MLLPVDEIKRLAIVVPDRFDRVARVNQRCDLIVGHVAAGLEAAGRVAAGAEVGMAGGDAAVWVGEEKCLAVEGQPEDKLLARHAVVEVELDGTLDTVATVGFGHSLEEGCVDVDQLGRIVGAIEI